MRSRRLRAPVVVRIARFCGYGRLRRLINAVAVVSLIVLQAPRPAPAAEPVDLLVFGDSLVAGYGLPQADGFVAQLQRALDAKGLSVKAINAGVSGDTTAGGRARLAWSLGQRGDQPDAAIVELGANDALRGLDPAAAGANLDAILAELQHRGIPTLLMGMRAPPNLGADYVRHFDAIYAPLAEKYTVPLYPFFLEGVAAKPTLNQPDGIHPNAQGVSEIVDRVLPLVVALVRRVEKDEMR